MKSIFYIEFEKLKTFQAPKFILSLFLQTQKHINEFTKVKTTENILHYEGFVKKMEHSKKLTQLRKKKLIKLSKKIAKYSKMKDF